MEEAKKGNWAGVGQAISDGITGALTALGGQAIIDTMLKTGIGPAGYPSQHGKTQNNVNTGME